MKRLPVVIVLLGSLAAALLVDRSLDDAPVRSGAPVIDASVFPISSAGARSSTWYCAGGTSDEEAFADHALIILNPTDAEAAVTMTAYAGALAPPSVVVDPEDLDPDAEETDAEETDEESDETTTTTTPSAGAGALSEPVTRSLTIAPQSRQRIALSEVVQAPVASALVESAVGGIVVEHEVTSVNGHDVKPCATGAAPEWHFAWGDTTVDARELLVLFNPFPQDAIVDGRFSTEDGIREPVRFDGLVVPGRGTIGIDLGDDVTRREEVAATITARSGRIVVDRILRLDGETERGLTVQTGVPRAQEAWVYPDGFRGEGIREEFVVYNPSDEVAEAELSFVVDDPETNGIPEPLSLSLAPGTHQVIDPGVDERVPADVAHSSILRSENGVPLVAERVVYSDRTNRRGVTVTTGSPVESQTWTFAAGAADASNDEFLVLINLDPQVLATVDVVAIAGGQRLPVAALTDIELAPGERRLVSLDENTDSESLPLDVTSSEPIVVERGLYEVGDEALGMSNAVGVPGPDGLRPAIDPLDLVPDDTDVGELDDPADEGDPDPGVPTAPDDVELPEPDETIVIDDPDAEATDPDAVTTTTEADPTVTTVADEDVPATTP